MCSSILESACGCLQEILLGLDWACVESVNQFGEICHLNSIEPSGPGTWYMSLHLCGSTLVSFITLL